MNKQRWNEIQDTMNAAQAHDDEENKANGYVWNASTFLEQPSPMLDAYYSSLSDWERFEFSRRNSWF